MANKTSAKLELKSEPKYDSKVVASKANLSAKANVSAKTNISSASQVKSNATMVNKTEGIKLN